MISNQFAVEAAANLKLVYLVKSKFDEKIAVSKMPSLFFIKVCSSLMIDKTDTAVLAACFPMNRDWIDAADFRGHLSEVLILKTNVVFSVFKTVARDPSTVSLIMCDSENKADERGLIWKNEKTIMFFQDLHRAMK